MEKSEHSAKPNLPIQLANVKSSGSATLHVSGQIMVHSDNATAPADTESPLSKFLGNEE